MLRRSRRLLAGLSVPVLLLSVAACGEETSTGNGGSGGGTAERLDAVTIEGEIGSAPEVTWESQMTADGIETEVLSEGEGAELGQGDQVLTHIWIGNGFTQEESFDSYTERPELVTVDDQLSPVFKEAIEGSKVGSRVAVTASADTAFGEAGNPSLKIANKDSVLVIVDLVSPVLDAPTGSRNPAPDWMPGINFTKGEPSGFDFSDTAEPTGEFRKAVLLDGDGPRVEEGQTVVARYLGQVYGGEEPFDQNYEGEPTVFPLTTVVEGWTQSITGVNVGTRMVVEIPPALGYGEAGNEPGGISGTDTLFFVIDVLAAG